MGATVGKTNSLDRMNLAQGIFSGSLPFPLFPFEILAPDLTTSGKVKPASTIPQMQSIGLMSSGSLWLAG